MAGRPAPHRRMDGTRSLRAPARNTLLADVVAPSRYGAAYGFERMMDNLAAMGGPLLAIGLVSTIGIHGAIGLSVIPGLLAVVAIMYAIRHTQSPTVRERRPIRIQVRPVLQGPLRRLFVGIGAFEAGNVAATLLILRAELLQPGRSDASDNDGARPLHGLQHGHDHHQCSRRPPRRSLRSPTRPDRRCSRVCDRIRRVRVRHHPLVAAHDLVHARRHRDRMRRDRRTLRRRHARTRTHPRFSVRGYSQLSRASATSPPAASPASCGQRSAQPRHSPTSPCG